MKRSIRISMAVVGAVLAFATPGFGAKVQLPDVYRAQGTMFFPNDHQSSTTMQLYVTRLVPPDLIFPPDPVVGQLVFSGTVSHPPDPIHNVPTTAKGGFTIYWTAGEITAATPRSQGAMTLVAIPTEPLVVASIQTGVLEGDRIVGALRYPPDPIKGYRSVSGSIVFAR